MCCRKKNGKASAVTGASVNPDSRKSDMGVTLKPATVAKMTDRMTDRTKTVSQQQADVRRNPVADLPTSFAKKQPSVKTAKRAQEKLSDDAKKLKQVPNTAASVKNEQNRDNDKTALESEKKPSDERVKQVPSTPVSVKDEQNRDNEQTALEKDRESSESSDSSEEADSVKQLSNKSISVKDEQNRDNDKTAPKSDKKPSIRMIYGKRLSDESVKQVSNKPVSVKSEQNRDNDQTALENDKKTSNRMKFGKFSKKWDKDPLSRIRASD